MKAMVEETKTTAEARPQPETMPGHWLDKLIMLDSIYSSHLGRYRSR